VDETAGRAGDINGFRLQIRGKTTPDGNGAYYLTSPLYNPALGINVTPWDEDATLVSSSFQKNAMITWRPKTYALARQFINPTVIQDVRGNSHNRYDGIKRKFTFDFQGDIYATQQDMRKLVAIYADTGPVRFYPRGLGENLLLDPLDCQNPQSPLVVSGAWVRTVGDATRGTLTVALAKDTEYNWQGFWVIFQDGATQKHMYIESGSNGVWTLLDKIQVPSQRPVNGTYQFSIQYILVRPNIVTELQATQDNFTSFTHDASFADYPSDLSVYRDTALYQMKGFTLELLEIEDLTT
jgi:hypothetical protein